MIARIFIILLVLIIVPDIYLDRVFLRRKTRYLWWQRVLFWLPALVFCIYTLLLASVRNFAPDAVWTLHVYLLLLGVVIIPKFVFAICSFLGWAHCRYHHTRTNYGNHAGAVLALAVIALTVYGCTFGFSKVVIRHETFSSKDLPAAFDGYRIVHISDAHVGTFNGSLINILAKEVDSINVQNADLIAFTGDIQNMRPSELKPAAHLFKSMKARDGIVSILGNHDYSEYIKAPESEKRTNERELINLEKGFGWTLLRNEHLVIRRGQDSIVIAGMENDGRPPFPQRGNLRRTLKGLTGSPFTIMLEHDPSAWRRKILPGSKAQLTLSGHTHAMQFEVLGWSPASLLYKEWGGMYHEGHRAINVSVGMGGFIPFRIGASNEIVVITLRKQ